MNFKLWLETKEQSFVMMELASVRCVSAGRYGGPHEHDEPAGPPRYGSAAWELDVSKYPQADKLLSGLDVEVVEDAEGGSFHEKWQTFYAYALVPKNREYEFEDAEVYLSSWDGKPAGRYESGRPKSGSKVAGRFKYAGSEDMAHQIMTITEVRGPNGQKSIKKAAPKPAVPVAAEPEGPEDWWRRQVRLRTTGRPPTRTGMDGHEQKWDGE